MLINFTRVMLHDEEMYSHPDTFNPDRFIPKEGEDPPRDPMAVAFGFGRR